MIPTLDLDALQQRLAGSPLQDWAADLPAQLDTKLAVGHGDLERWSAAVRALPPCNPRSSTLRSVSTSTPPAMSPPALH